MVGRIRLAKIDFDFWVVSSSECYQKGATRSFCRTNSSEATLALESSGIYIVSPICSTTKRTAHLCRRHHQIFQRLLWKNKRRGQLQGLGRSSYRLVERPSVQVLYALHRNEQGKSVRNWLSKKFKTLCCDEGNVTLLQVGGACSEARLDLRLTKQFFEGVAAMGHLHLSDLWPTLQTNPSAESLPERGPKKNRRMDPTNSHESFVGNSF